MATQIQNAQIANLIGNQPISPAVAPATPQTGAAGTDFATLLQNQLKVSNHAQTRLQSRNINLDQAAWQRVSAGVDKAAAKGSKEALVMVDNAALVVSVKNRTVITAVDQAHLKDNVFTNIDSAVIV